MQAHGLSTDRVIAFSDAELIDQTYDYIRAIPDDECDVVSDALYFLVGEILERFAQDEARAELARVYSDRDDPEDMNDLLDSIAGNAAPPSCAFAPRHCWERRWLGRDGQNMSLPSMRSTVWTLFVCGAFCVTSELSGAA